MCTVIATTKTHSNGPICDNPVEVIEKTDHSCDEKESIQTTFFDTLDVTEKIIRHEEKIHDNKQFEVIDGRTADDFIGFSSLDHISLTTHVDDSKIEHAEVCSDNGYVDRTTKLPDDICFSSTLNERPNIDDVSDTLLGKTETPCAFDVPNVMKCTLMPDVEQARQAEDGVDIVNVCDEDDDINVEAMSKLVTGLLTDENSLVKDFVVPTLDGRSSCASIRKLTNYQ